MNKKKQDEPSARERRLVRGVLSGQSIKQAAGTAGYSPSSAASNAYLVIQRPRVRSLLTEALERAGLTDDKLAGALLAALNSRVQIINTHSMAAVEVDMPNHAIRLAAADRIVAMYGYIPKRVEMPDPPGEGLTVHIHQRAEPKLASDINEPGDLANTLTVRIHQREDE